MFVSKASGAYAGQPWKEWDAKARKEGQRHTVFENDDQYTGEWKDNRRHGKGVSVSRHDKTKYEGEWHKGRRCGFGTMSVVEEVTKRYRVLYTGQWRRDKFDGDGTRFYDNGDHYEGGFRDGVKSGRGVMAYANGDVYEGGWLDDRRHGQGRLRLANGNVYQGAFESDQKHGDGRFFFASKGQCLEGTWVNDVSRCGTLVDCNRESASNATEHALPSCELVDAETVVYEAQKQAKYGEL